MGSNDLCHLKTGLCVGQSPERENPSGTATKCHFGSVGLYLQCHLGLAWTWQGINEALPLQRFGTALQDAEEPLGSGVAVCGPGVCDCGR